MIPGDASQNLDALLAGTRAVAFDFDGVIVESVEAKTDSFLALFADRPDLHPAIRRYHLEHLGWSRYEKLRWIYRELLRSPVTDPELARLGRRFSKLVLEATTRCPLVAGALATLAALGRAGLPAFVVSGTPQAELATIVERRRLTPWFGEVWGSPTPKPEILRGIMERYHLHSEELLFVGDGLSDWHAARELGLPFLLRETAAQAELVSDLEVPRVRDLTGLPQRLAHRVSEATT